MGKEQLLHYVPAGFPSPAEDYAEKPLDLNELLIKHPTATFFIRVRGDAMIQAGIFDNDILVVDRALSPYHRAIVVAVLEGEFIVKRLLIENKTIILASENPAYPLVKVKANGEFQVWGVVTYVIHKAK